MQQATLLVMETHIEQIGILQIELLQVLVMIGNTGVNTWTIIYCKEQWTFYNIMHLMEYQVWYNIGNGN